MVCPICKTQVPDDEPARPASYPFCGERCRLIDLGRWFDGKYRIPIETDNPETTHPDQPVDEN